MYQPADVHKLIDFQNAFSVPRKMGIALTKNITRMLNDRGKTAMKYRIMLSTIITGSNFSPNTLPSQFSGIPKGKFSSI